MCFQDKCSSTYVCKEVAISLFSPSLKVLQEPHPVAFSPTLWFTIVYKSSPAINSGAILHNLYIKPYLDGARRIMRIQYTAV